MQFWEKWSKAVIELEFEFEIWIKKGKSMEERETQNQYV